MKALSWTAAELEILADVYQRLGGAAAVAALPGRTLHAIEQRAHKLGLRSPIVAEADMSNGLLASLHVQRGALRRPQPGVIHTRR